MTAHDIAQWALNGLHADEGYRWQMRGVISTLDRGHSVLTLTTVDRSDGSIVYCKAFFITEIDPEGR